MTTITITHDQAREIVVEALKENIKDLAFFYEQEAHTIAALHTVLELYCTSWEWEEYCEENC